MKLAVSGSWESALLKVTWPDDTTPDENLVRAVERRASRRGTYNNLVRTHLFRFLDSRFVQNLSPSVGHLMAVTRVANDRRGTVCVVRAESQCFLVFFRSRFVPVS